MATTWKTLFLFIACGVTLVASRGHRHRHGYQHLKKHLHRLHLKHLKDKLLSTDMPTTIPTEPTTVKFEPTTKKVEVTSALHQANHLLALAEVDTDADSIFSSSEDDDLKSGLDAGDTVPVTEKETIWGRPLPKSWKKKQDKWISYDELKKEFKYDDKSSLPILDKPIYDVSDENETSPQVKGFEPVSMPKRFVSYDKNRDGFISVKELQKVTGAVENSDQAFEATDKNGDGYISPEEFMSAPWILEDDPDQNEQLEEKRAYLQSRMKALDDETSAEDEKNEANAEVLYPLNDD